MTLQHLSLVKGWQLWSLQMGKEPKDWRDALVIPVFKKGEHYNPAFLTSIPCKLLQHILVESIM